MIIPILAFALAAAVGRQVPVPSGMIVFAAQRFGEKLGIVYPLGPSHLYRIGTDGSSLRQITFGQGFDTEPRLSADQTHVQFWRTSSANDLFDEKTSYRLFSVSVTGTGLTDLKRQSQGSPAQGESVAKSSTEFGVFRDKGDRTEFVSSKGRVRIKLRQDDTPWLNPNGSRALLYPLRSYLDSEPKVAPLLADLSTGKVVKLSSDYSCPAWIDDSTMVASLGGSKSIALLDATGHVLYRKAVRTLVREAWEGEEETLEDTMLAPSRRRTYKLWDSRVFLVQGHHQMSDGGYAYTYRVDLNRGVAELVGGNAIEGVSGDGCWFIGSELGWVGGYKGPGAMKLHKLFLWDAKKLTKVQMGPRLMNCFGACFVPTPK